MEAPPGFEPGMEVLQTSALPLGDGALKVELNDLRKEIMERETGFEPATSTLARSHSTTELLPRTPRSQTINVTYGFRRPQETLPTFSRTDNYPSNNPQQRVALTFVSIVFQPEYPQEPLRDHSSHYESDPITKSPYCVEQYYALQ